MSVGVVCAAIVWTACGQTGQNLSQSEIDTVQMAIDGTVDGTATPADGAARPAPPGRHAPEEALAACASAAAGAICTFTHRERDLTGTCVARPDDAATLICRPNPPAALVEACAGKAAGDACSFTSREGEARTGLCHAPRFDGAPLLCAPERGGQCHHGADGGPADDHGGRHPEPGDDHGGGRPAPDGGAPRPDDHGGRR